jgi:hypothetical protein
MSSPAPVHRSPVIERDFQIQKSQKVNGGSAGRGRTAAFGRFSRLHRAGRHLIENDFHFQIQITNGVSSCQAIACALKRRLAAVRSRRSLEIRASPTSYEDERQSGAEPGLGKNWLGRT